jgi:choline dehydrogenase-like flavoprotein
MLIDAREIEPGTLLEADLCIAGAGAAGITLAREFRDGPLRVILLESGGFEGDGATQNLYRGEARGSMTRFADYTRVSRLRFFGGTTNHWAGWCRPLDDLDFRKRDWVPQSGWPIERADLDEAYARACALCEIQPFDTGEFAIERPDRPLIGIDPRAAQLETKPFFYSPPTRFGERYRTDIVDAPAVRLMLHANLVKLDVRADGRAITGIRVEAEPGRAFRVRARQYVLALGGLENPRLLLHSDDFFGNGIGNEHDLVGRNFMEHLTVGIGKVLLWRNEEAASLYTGKMRSRRHGHKVRGAISTAESFQATKQTLNYGAILSAIKGDKRDRDAPPDFGSTSRSLDRNLESLARLEPEGDLRVNRWPYKPTLARITVHGEQSPNPDSRVTLTSKRDRFGMRRIRLDWRINDLDRHSVYESTREVARGMIASFRGRVRMHVNPDDPDSFRISFQSHHMGTTRMSENPREGVVDANCKVHGLDNLYIAGSSVFPSTGFANPTLTLVALAWRMSNTLKARLG